jgi:hypothetical protein
MGRQGGEVAAVAAARPRPIPHPQAAGRGGSNRGRSPVCAPRGAPARCAAASHRRPRAGGARPRRAAARAPAWRPRGRGRPPAPAWGRRARRASSWGRRGAAPGPSRSRGSARSPRWRASAIELVRAGAVSRAGRQQWAIPVASGLSARGRGALAQAGGAGRGACGGGAGERGQKGCVVDVDRSAMPARALWDPSVAARPPDRPTAAPPPLGACRRWPGQHALRRCRRREPRANAAPDRGAATGRLAAGAGRRRWRGGRGRQVAMPAAPLPVRPPRLRRPAPLAHRGRHAAPAPVPLMRAMHCARAAHRRASGGGARVHPPWPLPPSAAAGPAPRPPPGRCETAARPPPLLRPWPASMRAPRARARGGGAAAAGPAARAPARCSEAAAAGGGAPCGSGAPLRARPPPIDGTRGVACLLRRERAHYSAQRLGGLRDRSPQFLPRSPRPRPQTSSPPPDAETPR